MIVVTLGWAVPASAATNPYPSLSHGYDVSYPNCSVSAPSGHTTFAIVGLGGGRPFTTNGCLPTEWAAAPKSPGMPAPALYFNTGYSGAYGRNITASSCPSSASALQRLLTEVPNHDQRAYTKAWQIGCSEAAYAATVASTNGETPSMWWADIETGNSWSTNQTLNGFTVSGISYEITTVLKSTAGVYSYASAWGKLVGHFKVTPPFAGDWGPGLTCTSSTGFSGAPVWVVQDGTQAASSSPVDLDTGCG